MRERVWQHPFVNVFKHFNVQSWKKSSKEGEVSSLMDRQLKSTVYRITGSIPAGNFILLPKTTSQSLGLTGRFMYLLFKPLPGKYFVVHIDVATQDGLVVRISFSNLFKEFKSTSTWLQFPFLCNASVGGNLSSQSVPLSSSKDQSGPAPFTSRWTVLSLDMVFILSMYLNRHYSYIKSLKLCANMLVKNVFTSDTDYETGLSLEQVKKAGVDAQGRAPMPREMAYPLTKGQKWVDIYDIIRFPSEATKKPFDSIQSGKQSLKSAKPGSPKRVEARSTHVSQAVTDRVTLIDRVTAPKQVTKHRPVASDLPLVGVVENGDCVKRASNGEVHVFAHPDKKVLVHREDSATGKITTSSVRAPATIETTDDGFDSLKPDPILKLQRIVGFGGSSTNHALWTSSGTAVVYPSHAVVVSMEISNGHQRFFVGHTDKVSCVSMNGSSSLLASGQTGQQSVVRIWKYQSSECLAMFKTHAHSLSNLSLSHSGGVLCGVGKDTHCKNLVVIWNTDQVNRGGQVSVLAKAHTDVDICRMKLASFDDTRMVSCGRDNVRLWRVKDGSLRSAPVNLAEHHSMEFSDCCFEAGYDPNKDPLDKLVYACSRTGHIFEIDYRQVAVKHVRRLLPTPVKDKDSQSAISSSGITINSMTVNEAFCVTGSDDGYLRLWPLDFKHVYLEAEHEGPVTATDISPDGIKIVAGTSTGNLGVLDVSTRGYTTIMRSHVGHIRSMSLDPIRRHMATVAEDHTIRVWDLDTMQQLYDFSAPKECPCVINYHPSEQVFACGFETGAVRVFNVATTSMVAEHKQHRGKVTGVVFSLRGDYLYSAGALGSLALYDVTDGQYRLMRVLANTVAHGDTHAPCSIAVNPDGKTIAFVGPSDFTVSVADARSLDELLRIDISCIHSGDSHTAIDTAIHCHYAPANVKHLLVTTSSHKILKFNVRTGKILAQIDNVHRSGCSALDVSTDGRHLATAGDKVVKIWDYHTRLDINFQVFIGHATNISQVSFTPDSLAFVSVGEAIMIWDFLAHHHKTEPTMEGRDMVKNYYTGEREEPMPYKSPAQGNLASLYASSLLSDRPRDHAPQPSMHQSHNAMSNLSAIHKTPDTNGDLMGDDIISEVSEQVHEMEASHNGDMQKLTVGMEDMMSYPQPQDTTRPPSHVTPRKRAAPAPTSPSSSLREPCQSPAVHQHFKPRPKKAELAQRRYTAPPNQAGLRLQSVIGYNGNGRGNMVWNADTGLFAYTSGCLVVVEDLNTGNQQHLQGHNEEISTLALQRDCQVLASASGASGLSVTQICLWDLQNMTLRKTISHHHQHDIVCMDYSRDDRFLVSVGDYRECSIVVWNAQTYSVITSTNTSLPMHCLRWDPFTVNEFVSVGEDGSVLFWLLDETSEPVSLNYHKTQLPKEVAKASQKGGSGAGCTSLVYGVDSALYIATSTGQLSVWDTRHNTCSLHWQADTCEIGTLVSNQGRLVTGGTSSHNLRLWSVGVASEERGGASEERGGGGITMEDEMTLDGAIISAAFDDTMDMGIVGTSSGTLWYINWTDRSSVRLVAGHRYKVTDLVVCNSQYLLTSSDDGSLRLWSIAEREQTLQFQVVDQSCNCLSLSPSSPQGSCKDGSDDATGSPLPCVVAGYSDGTVRMFDLNAVEMVLKMQPHPVAVTTISFSPCGRMILSGSSDGQVAISSTTTGITVRMISDHRGAPITCLDVAMLQTKDAGVGAPQLWLAASADRRVSVWSADWSKDFCELVDWLTFPAPGFTPDGTIIKQGDQGYLQQVPPSLARFSPEEPDTVVYTGYGMQKQLQFYSLAQRKVLRSVTLTHWATAMDLSPTTPLILVANNERLLKLMDYYEGSFQDFMGHDDGLQLLRFSPDGKLAISAAHAEIFLWEVTV